jgi:F0F1-type ATP synthase assembly protein I
LDQPVQFDLEEDRRRRIERRQLRRASYGPGPGAFELLVELVQFVFAVEFFELVEFFQFKLVLVFVLVLEFFEPELVFEQFE